MGVPSLARDSSIGSPTVLTFEIKEILPKT